MKKPTGSRALLVCRLKKVLQQAIPRVSSVEEADQLEYEVLRCRKSGLFDDAVSAEMLRNLALVRDALTAPEKEVQQDGV